MMERKRGCGNCSVRDCCAVKSESMEEIGGR